MANLELRGNTRTGIVAHNKQEEIIIDNKRGVEMSTDTGKEIAKSLAIAKNMDKKRFKRGAAIAINGLAERLASKDVILTSDQEAEMVELLERIEKGVGKEDDTRIRIIGSQGGKRKEGAGCISWYRNLVSIWSAGISIDFRNKRIFDYQSGEVLDFNKREIKPMTSNDIEEFIKSATKEN